MLESNGERYTLHQVISDYAYINLPDDAAQAAQSRLITYVIDFVETHKKDYELLELEGNTIRAALETAHDQHKQAELVRAACAFAPFLILRGFYDQAERYLKFAQGAAVQANNQTGLVETLLYLGEVAQKRAISRSQKAPIRKG